MFLRLVFALLTLLSVSAADSFDKPRFKKTVDLGPSRSRTKSHAKVNCYFFASFMVKEIDLGEKGADRLSIVPLPRETLPRCTRAKAWNEVVINPNEWTGYFKGVKSELVFFDADDGWNGGMGFAVYDRRSGKKIFEDSAVGELEFLPVQGHEVSLKYTRIIDGQCILPQDSAACWAQIHKTTGLESASMPDCQKGYEQSAQNLAKGRCQAQNSDTPKCFDREIQLARDQTKGANSVIAYPVEVTLGSKPEIKPVAGELQCWPAD